MRNPPVPCDQAFGTEQRNRQFFHCESNRAFRGNHGIFDRQFLPLKIINNLYTRLLCALLHCRTDFARKYGGRGLYPGNAIGCVDFL